MGGRECLRDGVSFLRLLLKPGSVSEGVCSSISPVTGPQSTLMQHLLYQDLFISVWAVLLTDLLFKSWSIWASIWHCKLLFSWRKCHTWRCLVDNFYLLKQWPTWVLRSALSSRKKDKQAYRLHLFSFQMLSQCKSNVRECRQEQDQPSWTWFSIHSAGVLRQGF